MLKRRLWSCDVRGFPTLTGRPKQKGARHAKGCQELPGDRSLARRGLARSCKSGDSLSTKRSRQAPQLLSGGHRKFQSASARRNGSRNRRASPRKAPETARIVFWLTQAPIGHALAKRLSCTPARVGAALALSAAPAESCRQTVHATDFAKRTQAFVPGQRGLSHKFPSGRWHA
jgi:hypothetical protein